MKEQEGIDLHFDLFSFINSYTERFLFLHLGIYWTASQASCLSFTSPVQENQGMSWWRFPHGWLAAEPTKLHYIMFSVFCPVTNEFWVLKFVFWHYLQRSFFFFFSNAFCASTFIVFLNAPVGSLSPNWTICKYILSNHIHIAMPWYRNARLMLKTSRVSKPSRQRSQTLWISSSLCLKCEYWIFTFKREKSQLNETGKGIQKTYRIFY